MKIILMPFQKTDLSIFRGIIKGVTTTGQLKIVSENGTLLDFDIKEVKMLF